jgi:TolB protein
VICALLLVSAAPGLLAAQVATAGLFEDHGDVGTVLHPGSLDYDPASGIYTISGSGANMWFATDAFHFV